MNSGQIHLQEFTLVSKADKVDREKGIIYGLVILGPESDNGYGYREKAMQQALKLYERRVSNANHTPPGASTSIYDRLGVWYNPKYEGGKIKGDYHFLKSHPLAERLCEAAERPDLNHVFGFSHDAYGTEERGSKGKFIESIDEVLTVDLVADPATVQSLWESRHMTQTVAPNGTPTAAPHIPNKPKSATGKRTTKTLRMVLTEALSPRPNRKTRRAALAWLKEMDGAMYPDDTMEATPGAAGEDLDADPPAHGAELFGVIKDLIDACLETADQSALAPDYLKKLNDIKAICGSGGEDDDDDEEEEGDGKQESKKVKGKLSAKNRQLQEENARLKREGEVRKLCDDAKHVPTATQLKALAPLSDTEAKALIENFKTASTPSTPVGQQTPPAQKPRSQSPGFKPEPHPGNNGQSLQEQQSSGTESEDQARARRVKALRTGRV